MIILRPATATDQKRIVAIIREAHINPTNLRWKRFILAVDDTTGTVVGTGQIKPHDDKSREVASIAVVPAYQRRGVAHQIIERLIADTPGPLYLTCRSPMGKFYEQFGFRAIGVNEMTPYFRRLAKIAGALGFLARDVTLMVMKRESPVKGG
jgi:N-acetylglutamate synthase-like GNAT family acetyltransferase